jgi:ribonuclease inhibitor
MEVILKGAKIKSISDFHAQIKEVLELPNYYGQNLDALWDCLTGWIEMPLTLIWEDSNVSKENLGEYAEKIFNILRDAEKEVHGLKIVLC